MKKKEKHVKLKKEAVGGCFYDKTSKEEIEQAHQFIIDMEKEGYKYTAYGKEIYIVENVFKPIQELERQIEDIKTQRDYYKARYLEFNEGIIAGMKTIEKRDFKTEDIDQHIPNLL